MNTFKPKIVAIVQARMGSTRLPGKVLAKVSGKPMLWHLFNRLGHARRVNTTVLATSTKREDDPLETFAKSIGLSCYRGSESDVLSRYYEAAGAQGADIVVRLTGDCPLIDPAVVDKTIEAHLSTQADYTSNTLVRTYPRGLDVEVMSMAALERAHRAARADHEREHVTPYVWQHPEKFKLSSVELEGILRRPDIRLTVDTPEDLQLIQHIFEALYQYERIFGLNDVIALLQRHPDWLELNSHIPQKTMGKAS